jgi:hypothetical protein
LRVQWYHFYNNSSIARKFWMARSIHIVYIFFKYYTICIYFFSILSKNNIENEEVDDKTDDENEEEKKRKSKQYKTQKLPENRPVLIKKIKNLKKFSDGQFFAAPNFSPAKKNRRRKISAKKNRRRKFLRKNFRRNFAGEYFSVNITGKLLNLKLFN